MTRIVEHGIERDDTILVVDDEDDIREGLQELLEAALGDVRVLTAADGEEALELLRGGRVDLIVSDFRMPGMDGLEFLAAARKIVPDVPRILITAFPEMSIALGAINEAHIENFFTKPLQPDKVIDVVWEVLDRRWDRLQRDARDAWSLDALRRGTQGSAKSGSGGGGRGSRGGRSQGGSQGAGPPKRS